MDLRNDNGSRRSSGELNDTKEIVKRYEITKKFWELVMKMATTWWITVM